MKTSDQIDQLAGALATAQGQIKDAHKAKQGYGYTYADLASILQIMRPVFSSNGLSVVQSTGADGESISVTTRIMHSSGQWIEGDTLSMKIEPKKGLSQAQCAGSVLTYARRYALAAAVGITQDDDDGASAAPMHAAPASPRDGLVAAARSAASRVGRDTALAALRDAGWESTSAVPEGHIGKAIALLEGLSK